MVQSFASQLWNRFVQLALACWLNVVLAVAAVGPLHAETPAAATEQAPAAAEAARFAIPPGQEAYILGLLEPVGFERPTAAGLVVDAATIDRDQVRFGLYRVGHDPKARALATVLVLPLPAAQPGDLAGKHLAVRVMAAGAEPAVAELAQQVARGIVERDKKPLFVALAERTPPPAQAPTEHKAPPPQPNPWLWPLLALLLLAPLALLKAMPGTAGPPIKTTHWLPALLQTLLFTYWGLWWPGLATWLPFLAAQIAFGYTLDAAMQWRKWRTIRWGFGPLPIVLSTNLFLQFPLNQFHWQLLAIAVALLSRDLIRRGGRHVLNPSAFGVAVVGVLELAFVTAWTPADVALRFWLPPNMTEVILLLALVVQFRLRPVLCTIGGALGLALVYRWTGHPVWTPSWGPITLALALLITDPATSPRTGPGRLLFGLFIGTCMGLLDMGLDLAGANDYYGKLLPIPLANALVPWFDAQGERLGARWSAPLAPRWNLAHVAIWWWLALGDLPELKVGAFAADVHAHEQTRGLRVAAGQQPTCADNPMFCNPFQFVAEGKYWAERLGREPQ